MRDGTLNTTSSEDINVKSPLVQVAWLFCSAESRPYGIVEAECQWERRSGRKVRWTQATSISSTKGGRKGR